MKRPSDLAVQFGRSCQSPRTGFIHLFLGQSGGDTIPIYENFCFALALIRQRNAEGVSEGKELFERLFAFQAPFNTLWDGNFPVYLHDYPRCWDSLLPLRLAPLLKTLLKHFSHILDASFKEKAGASFEKMVSSIERHRRRKGLPPCWERRYAALLGRSTPCDPPRSAQEFAEEMITSDLVSGEIDAERLIHPHLGVYIGPALQEGQEEDKPKPSLLEWWINPGRPCSLHPLQIELAALPEREKAALSLWSGAIGEWQIRQAADYALSFSDEGSGQEDKRLLRWLWAATKGIHSLCVFGASGSQRIEETERGAKIFFSLPETFDVSQNDLCEAAAYCNVSDETRLFVAEKKASVFALGDPVEIQTPSLSLQLRFDLIEGSGDFSGQISRANRPLQTACRGEDLYSAFDWKISLRTLRRSSHAILSLSISRLSH